MRKGEVMPLKRDYVLSTRSVLFISRRLLQAQQEAACMARQTRVENAAQGLIVIDLQKRAALH
jgi:hypothetical protein